MYYEKLHERLRSSNFDVGGGAGRQDEWIRENAGKVLSFEQKKA